MQEVYRVSLKILMHQDLVLGFHTTAELNSYERMGEIGYNIVMEFP